MARYHDGASAEAQAERKKGISAKEGAVAGHAGEEFGSTGSYHSNMPDYVMVKLYPKYKHEENALDDTITGIDKQMDADVSQAEKHRSKSKF